MKTERETEAASYVADAELVIAAQVAMELSQPLLLTGEPGTGKTAFAEHLAQVLAPQFFSGREQHSKAEPFRRYTFDTKSTSIASDLFYRFDSLRRFQAVHDPKMSSDNRDYLTLEALGNAIVQSLPWDEVSDLFRDSSLYIGPVRSVVLIDEVDKAPRDFPNDLLNEIDRMFFRIPEVSDPRTGGVRRVTASECYRPVVVLTSNSERNLPAPFLRRCVFHHIQFPEREQKERLTNILKVHLAGRVTPLADSAIDFFYDIREGLQLEKRPTSHELLQWVRVLHSRKWFTSDLSVEGFTLAELPTPALKATFGVIAKTAGDVAQIERLADEKLKPVTAKH